VLGDDGAAILAALAVADRELVALEVDVLDPELTRFEQAKSGAVEQ
jgi:hypothetical protein